MLAAVKCASCGLPIVGGGVCCGLRVSDAIRRFRPHSDALQNGQVSNGTEAAQGDRVHCVRAPAGVFQPVPSLGYARLPDAYRYHTGFTTQGMPDRTADRDDAWPRMGMRSHLAHARALAHIKTSAHLTRMLTRMWTTMLLRAFTWALPHCRRGVHKSVVLGALPHCRRGVHKSVVLGALPHCRRGGTGNGVTHPHS